MRRAGFADMILKRGYRQAAEIGVSRGVFSEFLLRRTGLDRLYSVDNWAQRRRRNRKHQPWGTSLCMKVAIKALAPYGDRSMVLRMPSVEAAKFLQNAVVQLDFVYIDATHSYDAVKQDLAVWYPLVRVGGVVAGHDYDKADMRGCAGVIRAVDEFVAYTGLPLHVTSGDRPQQNESWWVEKC